MYCWNWVRKSEVVQGVKSSVISNVELNKKYSKKESKFETKENNQSSIDVGGMRRAQGSVNTIHNRFIGSSL